MAGRFEFESPGAAFTSQIAQALMQRKAEERQQLLDSLQFSAEQRANDEARRNAEMQQQQIAASKASMASQAQQDELARLGALTQNMTAGANPEEMGYSPEDIQLMQKWGRLKSVPVPQTSTSATFTDEQGNPTEGPVEAPAAPPAPKTRYSFVGTPQEQEKERLRGLSGQLIQGLMQNPKQAEVGAFLAQIAQANDGVLPPDVLAQYAGPGRHLMTLGPSGKVTDTHQQIGPLDQVVQLGYPPSSYFAPEPAKQWVGVDPDDPTGGTQIYMDRQGNISKVRGSRPNAAGTNSANLLGIPEDAYYKLSLSIGELGADPQSVDEAALADYRTKAAGAIGISKLPNNVKLIAMQYLNNPNAALQIANQMLEQGKLTAKDVDALSAAIGAIAPEHVKDILNANPYNPDASDKEGIFSKIWNAKWR